jgi:hypothetical protein
MFEMAKVKHDKAALEDNSGRVINWYEKASELSSKIICFQRKQKKFAWNLQSEGEQHE